MVSDLTPEETLRAEACEAYGYGITVVVPLDVALAAVAAERERVLAAVRNHMGPREFTGLDAEAISRQLGAAREGSRDE
ncbi:MAG TPA: hypothetical protein PKD63_00115 [Solirubrobacteraceae bacterium]|nr:hypothetical protein [Solirubrobacteraceae bacterium]